MAKPNYDFAKRQKELAKKQKKEEKRLRKLATGEAPAEEDTPELPDAPSSDESKPDPQV